MLNSTQLSSNVETLSSPTVEPLAIFEFKICIHLRQSDTYSKCALERKSEQRWKAVLTGNALNPLFAILFSKI